MTIEDQASVAPDGMAVRVSRRDSTVVVKVAGHVVAAGLAALRRLLADPMEDQGNLFVAVEVDDDRALDPVLLAALAESPAASPRCHLTVRAANQPVTPLSAKAVVW